eukprot:NODE_152_length_16986_cov_0.478119.p13 type:complete len:116 gc:universal NODE_152_length_16986_cov_0.478119:7839-7492(-)
MITYMGDKIPFKIYTKSGNIDVSYNREIRVDVRNAIKVTIAVVLGIYPQEKKKIANFLTIGRSQRTEKKEYRLGSSVINMEQFLTLRPQSVPAVFQLLGDMNVTISTQCYTSSVE